MGTRSPSTADFSNVGIINHLTIMAQAPLISKKDDCMCFIDLNMSLWIKSLRRRKTYGSIFLNGRLVGFHPTPQTVVRLLKLYKLNSIINCFTSISWNPLLN